MAQNVAISELKLEGSPRCLIDLVGATHWDPNEPLLEVLVSPLEGQKGNQRRVVKVGAWQWPLLKMGSIWEDGFQVGAIGKTRSFDIEVSAETVRMFTFIGNDDEGKRIIPSNDYNVFVEREKLGREHGNQGGADSWCLGIKYNNDPFGIVVSVSEIIRFFHARSSDLTEAAIFGDYKHDLSKIINIENSAFDENAKRCVLHLQKKFENKDGWIIGRVLQSPVAARATSLIHDSLNLNREEKSAPCFPKCGIPFEGKTRWTVRGIEIGDPGRRRFLILEIRRCTAPFPFEELEISRDADSPVETPEKDEPEFLPVAVKKPKPASGVKLELHSQRTPLGNVSPVPVEADMGGFSFLDNKEIIRNERLTPTQKAKGKAKFHSIEVHCLTTAGGYGQGDGSAFARVVGETDKPKQERKKGVPANVDMHADIILALNKVSGVQAARCTEAPDTVSASAPSRRGKGWELLEDGNLRRVGVISIQAHGEQIYFLEIEQPEKENGLAARLLSLPSGGLIERAQFERVVGLLARNQGKVPKGGLTKAGVRCASLNHTWGNAGECAKRIFEAVRELGVGKRAWK